MGKVLTADEQREFDEVILKEEKFNNVLVEEKIDLKKSLSSKSAEYHYARNDSSDKFELRETDKLFDFGENLKVLLTIYNNLTTNEKSYVVRIWKLVNQNLSIKAYLNGSLEIERQIENKSIDEEITEFLPIFEQNVVPFYDPWSCVRDGNPSCCTFEGITYQHCGKYCGAWEKSGGGKPINAIDSCCLDHDACLMAKRPRCTCHDEFLQCSYGKKGPGDATIRWGIWLDAASYGCQLILG
ncbi:hypothetical protein EKO25_10630 [Bacillus sp. SAJ1]|nr:hypothetical protein EKO25_10630 [Bacillus sp. SAJ1]